jgi:hypothetical protein
MSATHADGFMTLQLEIPTAGFLREPRLKNCPPIGYARNVESEKTNFLLSKTAAATSRGFRWAPRP